MNTGPNVASAKEILRGRIVSPEEMFWLAEGLRGESQFSYARQLFARLRRSPVSVAELQQAAETDPQLRSVIGAKRRARVALAQKHALCTYKDPDIPADVRLDRALAILGEEEEVNETRDQETLGLAGAIFKRKWQLDAQRRHLESSLFYYRRGYEQGPERDYGYTGVNAAYVLDLLARIESSEGEALGLKSDAARRRAEEAAAIRRRLAEVLPPLAAQEAWLEEKWWFVVTVAEALFGSRDYDAAGAWLRRARALVEAGKVADWEFEATARQLADIARLQSGAPLAELEGSEAWRALREFLTVGGREYAAGLRTAFVGKIGLALSGGGFRASLFHIGVLAKLAELDVLRSVEVLSCVSGGSIVGAHYYLEVRHLLQTKPDEEITREDYLEIVSRLERDFLDGVQSNIRTRVAAEVMTNLKTVFKKHYSRTERVGELFEEALFSKVRDGGGDSKRWLDELRVRPEGEREDFQPKKDNWRRAAKVPVLVLNATTLNTGHNWQFTASWMGEPAASINTEVDGNRQLRSMRYEDAPEGYRRFRLGRAVAASASLPGIFDPLVLDDLYPEMTVRLVDGGVHDNQGVASLLEQECTVVLVSDASGQMETEANPSAGLLAVPMRSLDMVMARVREEQYKDLRARRDSALLRGLMFLHLKKDLDVDPLGWVGCPDPFEAGDESRPVERRGPLTGYGVRKDVQKLLAAIRTDLDAFSDTEAYALMTSGYLMTEREFTSCVEGFEDRGGARSSWRFLALEEPMKKTGDAAMMRLLEAASSRVLKEKVWKYSRPIFWLAVFAGVLLFVAATAGGAYALLWFFDMLSTDWLALIIVLLVLAFFVTVLAVAFLVPVLLLLVAVLKRRDSGKSYGQIISGILLAFVGWIPARVQLHVLDKLFLSLGDIKDRATSTTPQAGPLAVVAAQPTGVTAAVRAVGANAVNAAVKAVGAHGDGTSTADSLSNAIDQRNIVEAIGALFKARGYDVKCFPREYEINPLQVNIDLYAEGPANKVLAMVRTASDPAGSAGWETASSLQTAAWFAARQQPQASGGGSPAAPAGGVGAWLFLIDVKPDATLRQFEERGVLRVIEMDTEDIRGILLARQGGPDDAPGAEFSEAAARWLAGVEEFRTAFEAPARQMEVAT